MRRPHLERVGGDPNLTWSSTVDLRPDGAEFYFEVHFPPGRYRFPPLEGARWARTPEEVEIREGEESPAVERVAEGLGG